jgi:zinc protease
MRDKAMSVDRMGFMAVSLARLTPLWHLSKDAWMKRALTGVAILVVVAAATLTGQSGARATRPAAATARTSAAFDRSVYAIPHKTFVLDNGLRLIVHEDHSVPVVAVNVWYHVGSRNEQRGKTGFAHLFEHFFFNGSEHYPKGFREAMDDLGANNRNGTTSGDRTNFFEDVPVSGLERTLYLEADRLGFLAKQINEAMLNRERGVVQNEKRQGENQPYGRVFSQAVTRLYPPNHPYSWPTIGSMEDLNAANLQDVQTWYRSFYGPNNCVLSLAGDITPEQALALVKKYFDGIPAGPPVDRATQWVPRLDGNIRDEMRDQVAQTRVYRFYHAPAWRDGALREVELAANVLSGSRSARLDRALVYDKPLATAVNLLIDAQELASLFVAVATLRAGVDPADAEREIDRVVGEFIKQGPTDAELQRARARLTSQFVRGAERLGGFGGRSDILAESLTFDGRTDGYLDRLERLSTATASDVRQAAQRWLDAPHYTLTIRPAESRQSGATAVDRTVLPPLGAPPDVAFPAVQRSQLSNGASVLLVERHTAPLVNVSLAVDAGFAADVPEKAGLASLTLDLMDDGTATRDTFAIVDELDRLGATISTASTLDLSLVRLQALAGQLRPSLDVLADVVLRPSFPPDMLKLAVQRRLAQIGQEKATPTTAAVRLVPPMLYGTAHAYGAPLTGSGFEATVSKLTREDLVGWHRDWFHPSRTTIIVTGDTTMAVIKPELERAFAAWRSGTAPTKRIQPVPATTGKRVYLVDRPGAPQSVIVAAHASEAGGQPEDLAIDTVMLNFGGIATSRLNRNLRLDKAWSYGTQGVLQNARGQRPFIVIAPVQTDKTREAVLEVAKELRDVAGARPVRGEEFASIMRTQTLGLPGRWATLASLENAVLQIVNYKYPDDYFSTYAKRVRTLSEQNLADAAAKYIHPDRAVWLVIGDLAQIESGIRQLNLGKVIRLDADGRPMGPSTQ